MSDFPGRQFAGLDDMDRGSIDRSGHHGRHTLDVVPCSLVGEPDEQGSSSGDPLGHGSGEGATGEALFTDGCATLTLEFDARVRRGPNGRRRFRRRRRLRLKAYGKQHSDHADAST
ncbi:MAG TPA: hypothetical protein VFF66_03245 [Brevundimonas sp.]|nr:hypothetical protein [Brevundimonas sp.]